MTSADHVRRLIDRQAVVDRIIEFAFALDAKDFERYASLYDEDGVIVTPRSRHAGRAGLADFVRADLGKYHSTQHVSAGHIVTIDGDRATARSSLLATHAWSDQPDDHWSVGGWYDLELRRVDEVWLFTSVTINRSWVSGRVTTS